MEITRRRFLLGVAATGAGAALPAAMFERAMATVTSSPNSGPFFLTGSRLPTCEAICARLVPSGASPGATEARAGVFIDRFLAAFELPTAVADAPAIWLRGRYTGRNPYPDPATGRPSKSFPPDEKLTAPNGQAHFIALDGRQELVWRAHLYGSGTLVAAAGGNHALANWASQVATGLIPGVSSVGLRQVYTDGLAAFDSWSEALFHAPFSGAAPLEQDLMLAVAGNLVLDNLPLPLPPLGVLPPAAAEALYPVILGHTFQACYGLPEYRWTNANPLWPSIGYDGDTQPLGNSVYDANVPGAGPGQGPNEGFGAPGAYVPKGDYREYRPVAEATSGPGLDLLTESQLRTILEAVVSRRARLGGAART